MNGCGIFLMLLGLYLAALIAVGWRFSGRHQSAADFWLAGRTVGPITLGFSAAASWLTAGAILAVIGFFMLSGMGSVWGFVAPNILALLVIALLVKRIKSLPAITQPELLEQRYGSAIRAPVALIIAVVMILFAVADIKGFAFLLQVYYGLSPVWAAVIVALAVSVYVTLGGFSAVVWTDVVQYLFLAVFVLAMAVLTAGAALSAGGAATAAELLADVPDGWWNPLSIGLPMALIFTFAILPGWISEQDPWQRVWAARDARSARIGMVVGAVLIAVVFGGCAVIAISLNRLMPEVAAMGFPAGMARAEPALLDFIVGRGFPPVVVALTAIGLAAAAMSCADTFAASGASCISRDLYQRFIRPDATMTQMLRVNRISVLIIVLSATITSFMIDSIIDAIHIATFIASAAYFFPLMGGIYWKRATREGAMASLIAGGSVQILLATLDLINTPAMAPPWLETISPLLMGHGVIAGMAVGGVVFVGVSLATRKPESIRLAPFFKDEAENLAAKSVATNPTVPLDPAFPAEITESNTGDRIRLHCRFRADRPLDWPIFMAKLTQTHPAWITPAGPDAACRLTRPDMLACVTVTRGDDVSDIWLRAEPRREQAHALRREMQAALGEVSGVLPV